MRLLSVMILMATPVLCGQAAAISPSAAEYSSIQEAVDANPGKMIFVPAGDYVVNRPILLNVNESGLYGPGRIIQTEEDQSAIRVMNVRDIRIKDLTITRTQEDQDSTQPGIRVDDADTVVIEAVRLIDWKTYAGVIRVASSRNVTIRNCLVENYKRLRIDDRMANEHYGYSFQSVDGTGISIRYCNKSLIEGNRVVETHFVPSRASREEYELGSITDIREDPPPGRLASRAMLDEGYTNNWHQGSAIIVTGLGTSGRTIIRGNYIENAAQGIDLHADNVIVANNIVDGAMIGMKAMHGSRHILIDGNQFLRFDLWGVLLQPGAASADAQRAKDGEPAREQNIDGGSIISNNIFSEIGYGGQYWNWENQNRGSTLSAIVLGGGQLPENPPLRKVLVQGNIVYDVSADGIVENDEVVHPGPRHKYAVFIDEGGDPPPEGILVRGNLLDSGFMGVSNVSLE